MQMVTIPSGLVVVGTGDEQANWLAAHTSWAEKWIEKGFFAREQPQHEVHVENFAISIHPVMVEYYRAFIAAGGYENGCYWTESGRLWLVENGGTEPAYWDEDRWVGDERLPVVGVSWFEAAAFCCWWGKVLGRDCRLPTEVEWEKAAGGGQERLYPWGNRFDSQKCNIRTAEINHTVPVGTYSPVGDSPYGCREMVGNVSEWVLSKFAPYPYIPGDGREDLEGTVERVTRGGSWHSPEHRARISARGMNDPWFQDNDLGFRIVCEPLVDKVPTEI